MSCFALMATPLLTGCSLIKNATTPDPFSTSYELNEAAIDGFINGDTLETAMCGGPLYAGNRPAPGQNTKEYDEARAKKITELLADAEAMVKACEAAQPAITKVRTDYITYLDELQKADTTTNEFAGSTLQPLSSNVIKQAIALSEYQALAHPSVESTSTFASSFTKYLAIGKAANIAALYSEDFKQIAGFSALALDINSKNTKLTAANTKLDQAMETDFPAAAKALEPIGAKLDAVSDSLRRISSADYYFSLEALGYMESEVTKLKPAVDTLTARDGLSKQDAADTKTLYEGYSWWVGELKTVVESQKTQDLIVAQNPRSDFNPFEVDRAYAAEEDGAFKPGQNYGNAVAVLTEATPTAKQGYFATAWSGVKSAVGKAKTVVGVGIDSIGTSVQAVTTVVSAWQYGLSDKDKNDIIRGAVTETVNNYNKGLSGSSTFTTAGKYLEGIEKDAGEAAGAAVGGVLTWGAKQAGTSKDTQATISNWSTWAASGITKTTVGMFTGMAKGIYTVADKKSSSADVAGGIVEIGLGAIGGSKVILKASQVPGLTQGAYSGMKNLGQAMLNLGKSAANTAEKNELKAGIKAALQAKGLTPAAVDKLISDSVKIEIAEATAKALEATRADLMKRMRDLIASGGKGWYGDMKGTVASSWSDLVTKSFTAGGQGFLDAGTTVIGSSLKDYVENLVAAGITDTWLTDFVKQAISVAPDAEQVDGTYKGNMKVVKITIPDSAKKTAEDAQCLDIFKQMEGQNIPLTLDIDASGGKVKMSGEGGGGSGSCNYSGGQISMQIASKGSTISFSGTAKLRKEGGVALSGSWRLPYQGTAIIMSGTWTATK